jgi:alkylation response protein AidB-like acyl-CoA dehydrogenase
MIYFLVHQHDVCVLERWGLSIQALRFARVCLEDSMAYSFKRKTFGKRLIDHPVIRLKLAHMARQIESSQNWLESITYQMKTQSKAEQNQTLSGAIALCKVQVTTVTILYYLLLVLH